MLVMFFRREYSIKLKNTGCVAITKIEATLESEKHNSKDSHDLQYNSTEYKLYTSISPGYLVPGKCTSNSHCMKCDNSVSYCNI